MDNNNNNNNKDTNIDGDFWSTGCICTAIV